MCDGTGACDKYPAGTVCQEMALHRVDADVGVPLRRHRAPARRQPGQSCAPFNCGDRRPLHDHLHRRQRLRRAQQLQQRQLRQEADRRRLRRRPGVQLGLLRAGGLLRRPPAPAPAGRATVAEQRRDLHQRARRRQDPLGQCADQGATTCGTDGMCDGKAACRPTPPARSVWRRPARASTATLAGTLRRHGHLRRAARSRRAIPYVVRHDRRRAGPRARPTPTARTATSATGRSAARRSTAPTARPATECASGSCQQGVCCAGCVHRHLHVVRADRHAAASAPRSPASTDPLNQCADSGADQLRHRRVVQRRRRVPAVPARPRLRHADVHGLDGDAGGALRRRRQRACRARRSRARLTSAAAAAASPAARRTPTARRATSARRRAAALKPLGAACARRQRVQQRVLRAGRLLQDGLHGELPVLRADRHGRHLLDRAGRPGSAGPVHRPGRHQLRHRRHLRRQRRLPPIRQRHLVRGGDLQRGQLHARSGPATAPAPARRRPPISCGAYNCGTSGTCLTTCTTDSDCIAPNICNAGQCTKKPLGTTCTRRHRVRVGPLPAGRLLQLELHRDLPVVRARGQRRHLHVRRRSAPIR